MIGRHSVQRLMKCLLAALQSEEYAKLLVFVDVSVFTLDECQRFAGPLKKLK